MYDLIIKLRKSINYLTSTICFIGSTVLLISSISLSLQRASKILTWDITNKTSHKMEITFLIEPTSLGFRSVVLLISGSVLIFSKYYMESEKFFNRFHLLVLRFVLSMIVLIFGVRILTLILGWDGLGVTSYLLVIYYSSTKRYNAGILTAMINRVGDVLVMLSIRIILIEGGYNFNVSRIHRSSISGLILFLVIFARITKRAQIPFSAWLPAAMAAPTPVSSLVHSSTLVTAGVYLIIRYESLVSSSRTGQVFLLFVGLSTITMAGLRAIIEIDIKKIVALSTLSQLGLIFTAMGINQWAIAYFHIITHAYTKALLFIRVGNIIHSCNDYQDLRQSTVSPTWVPISSSMLVATNLRLGGFPFLAGFYSKDLWLETTIVSSNPSVVYLGFILGVIITCLYSARIVFYLSVRRVESPTINLQREERGDFKLAVVVIWSFSLLSGSFLGWVVFLNPVIPYIPTELKVLTVKILILSLGFYFVISNKSLWGISELPTWVSQNMWGLGVLSSFFLLKISLLLILKVHKYVEKRRVISLFYEGVYNEVASQAKSGGGPDWVMLPAFAASLGVLVATLV